MPHPALKIAGHAGAILLSLAGNALALAGVELAAPYVGSRPEDVAAMLDLAEVGPGDYVIDLGAGDGRIVIAAAQRGASGHGVEINRHLVEQARNNAAAQSVAARTAFIQEDIFETSLAGASVVTLFLRPEANLRLRPRLLRELSPGTRVVSNRFGMRNWEPDARRAGSSTEIFLWYVPARLHGSWQLRADNRHEAGHHLILRQDFQHLRAVLKHHGQRLAEGHGRVRGHRFILELEHRNGATLRYSGQAREQSLEGVLQDGSGTAASWRATREAGTPPRTASGPP